MAADSVIIDRSYARLRASVGGEQWIRRSLSFLSHDIVTVVDDDFTGSGTISLTGNGSWTAAANGTAAAGIAYPATKVRNGAAVLVTGTDDDGYGTGYAGLVCVGELHTVFTARVAMSAVTTAKFELGLTDATGDAGAVNALATPTYTADDCVLWCFDTDDAGNATGAQGIAVKNTTGLTKLEPSAITPAANAYLRFGVALKDTSVRHFVYDANDALIYDSNWVANGITSDDLLTPWLFVQARAGAASRTLTVDQVQCWQRRTTG